jgi:hypothetical protein
MMSVSDWAAAKAEKGKKGARTCRKVKTYWLLSLKLVVREIEGLHGKKKRR